MRILIQFCVPVRGFGIIGGGAVLGAASALAGALAPIAGEKKVFLWSKISLGLVTAGGLAVAGVGSRAACVAPFCVARSGQCCPIQPGRRPGRFRCPRSC